MKKIYIGLPHNYHSLEKRFTVSLIGMMKYFYQNMDLNEYSLDLIINEGLQLDEMRNDLMVKLLENGADYILCLDTDMEFPKDSIVKMAKHLESADYDAVCGIYCFKTPNYMPMLFKEWNDRIKRFEFIDEIPNKPFEIKATGAGILMIRGEFLQKCTPPLFYRVRKNECNELSQGLGEDYYFFWKHKPKLLCDPSINCIHNFHRSITIQDFKDYNNKKDLKITSKDKNNYLVEYNLWIKKENNKLKKI